MSWDATLYAVTEVRNCTECGHELDKPRREESVIDDWNYTSNVSPMIYRALEGAGIALDTEEGWWQHLSGMSGPEGRDYLAAIIAQLEAGPERFRAMNPPNGWGCYDGPHGVLGVLRKMRDAVPEGEASAWHVSG
jgi:hypothetical protein